MAIGIVNDPIPPTSSHNDTPSALLLARDYLMSSSDLPSTQRRQSRTTRQGETTANQHSDVGRRAVKRTGSQTSLPAPTVHTVLLPPPIPSTAWEFEERHRSHSIK